MHFKQVIRKEEIHYQRSKDNYCLLLRRSRLVVQEVLIMQKSKYLDKKSIAKQISTTSVKYFGGSRDGYIRFWPFSLNLYCACKVAFL